MGPQSLQLSHQSLRSSFIFAETRIIVIIILNSIGFSFQDVLLWKGKDLTRSEFSITSPQEYRHLAWGLSVYQLRLCPCSMGRISAPINTRSLQIMSKALPTFQRLPIPPPSKAIHLLSRCTSEESGFRQRISKSSFDEKTLAQSSYSPQKYTFS